MARICPECGYPNPDGRTSCFRCNTDISDDRMFRESNERQSMFFKDCFSFCYPSINDKRGLLRAINIMVLTFYILFILTIVCGITIAVKEDRLIRDIGNSTNNSTNSIMPPILPDTPFNPYGGGY
ncbi:MAG: hypothetical protein IJS60_08585 [Abditibacteriota bacterium]|nr:hypothetical protein [Abditibacteriota bacterium]